jgi:CheY-like chemotaxis protein
MMAAPGHRSQPWGAGMKKILIVDDSRTALLMSEMILKRYPFEIVTASNGEEALAMIADEPPDLILMDILMPGMDGLEVVKRLRKDKENLDIPVIMVTTQSNAEVVEQSYLLGCSDYITKPLSSAELLAKIRSLLGE